MATMTFDFDDGESGHVRYEGAAWTPGTGWANCQSGIDPSWEDRAFFSFNTSALNDYAVITKVEFYQRLRDDQPQGSPAITNIDYYIGQIVGGKLDGPAEWEAGTKVHRENSELTDTWIDISNVANPTGHVARVGDTDIAIRDASSQGGGDSAWGTYYNQSKSKCQLRVTYEGIVEMGVAAIVGSTVASDVVPGSVAFTMNAAAAVVSAQTSVLYATYSALLDALAVASSTPSSSIVPGAIALEMEAAFISALAREVARLGGALVMPDGRTVTVSGEDRVVVAAGEDRVEIIVSDGRVLAIAAEERTLTVPAETRTLEA